ncbi:uncharacterized protein LOC133900318 [Phragmites australis]|uniref:uncharacterized protein LOC133900318 n=1 Tax=Phragmites australis TaxID=29695 RepID=UPI002D79719D|nr:uncharacterized protein LOC133900318 [Phragmites australis]
MYHSGNPSCCYGVHGEVNNSDLIIPASRPDALLADGAVFLPPSSYMLHYSQQGRVGPPRPSSQTSSGMAAAASFRRVLSTGDLLRPEEEQRVAAAGRYSVEERRERIDKYRSKRNHRNFQKKITYACRKTLADSRPRVKGRFARNGADYTEAEQADVVQASCGIASESPPVNDAALDRDTMMNLDVIKDSDSGSGTTQWWPAMQEALATGMDDDLDNLIDPTDEEMLAAYLGVSSISLYSPSYSSPSGSGQ